MSTFVHESSFVDPGAELGENTKVWHFSHIMPKTKIGKDCSFGQNVFVANNVTIGDGVKVQNNVSIYEGVILEDYVFCGPSMVFTNVKNPRSKFPVGGAENYDKTIVREGATLGANCTVVCGSEVGAWSFVAAGAVITKDVKPYTIMAGVPAKVIGYACKCGERLTNVDQEKPFSCEHCGREYVFDKSSEQLTHV